MKKGESSSGHHMQTGRLGEEIARTHLIHSGYSVQAQNERTPYGEIDLIACHQGTWVFVEVKTRRTKSLGPPEISVHNRKQEHLLKAVQYYCQNHLAENVAWRIDVIAIQLMGNNLPPEIVHFENAVSG